VLVAFSGFDITEKVWQKAFAGEESVTPDR